MDLIKVDDRKAHKDLYGELHARIEIGEIDSVKSLLQEENPGQPLCFQGISALKRSFCCKQVEICSFLIHFGASFKDDTEAEDLEISEEDIGLVNNYLCYFNQKTEESCIYKLMTHSHFSSGVDKKCNDILFQMYKDLFQSESIKFLMKVIENESPDIVYDFRSKNIDRIYFGECTGLSGITIPETNTIYIGAENLKSVDPEDKRKVAGVVAEEFCHLAMKYLFENVGKPYRIEEESSEKVKKFQELVYSIESHVRNSETLTPIVKDVFLGPYEEWEWEYELIARVPHLMGIHGEEAGREMLKISSELSELLKFYDDYIAPECKSYTDPSYYSRPMIYLESLNKKKGFITAKEKEIVPLITEFNSFKNYLVPYGRMQMLYTNCTKLSALQIYHELKKEIRYHVDKVCLFLTMETFEENKLEVCDAFRSQLCRYLILVTGKEEPKNTRESLDFDVQSEGIPEVIIISCVDQQSSNYINYKWSDVTYGFKEFCLEKTINFKGKKCKLKEYLNLNELCFIFKEDDIMELLCGEIKRVEDGIGLFSQGFNLGTYIERRFWAMTVDKKIFENFPLHSPIFISGLCRRDFQQLSIDEKLVQWLEKSDDEIQEGKLIFIIDDVKAITFEDFAEKFSKKDSIFLNYSEKVFYLRNSDSAIEISNQHKKKITITEEETINLMYSKKIVIISDDSGCGKSTVLSSLIRHVKANTNYSLMWRIDLNKFSTNEKNPLSLAHVKENSNDEEVLNHLFLMIRLNNEFEKHIVRKLSKDGVLVIFFDGFDEIASKYKGNALKLFSVLADNTAAKIVITTRKHCQQELEEKLKTISLQLVPLSREDQVAYLEKLWKSQLKYPCEIGAYTSEKEKEAVLWKINKIIRELGKENSKLEYHELILEFKNIECGESLDSIRSKIDNVYFIKLAKNILCDTLLGEETLELMGIPLHLYMIGTIHYDGNFNVKLHSDIFHLYSQFIEQKILIYLEDKLGLWHEGSFKDEKQLEVKQSAYRIHFELADQLLDKGKVYLSSEINKKDYELCTALGIVFIQDRVLFIHHTFAEFFKAESLKQNMQRDIFMDVLLEERYNVVRRFLLSGFQKKDFQNITKKFFKDANFLVSLMEKVVNRDIDMFSLKIVKRVVENFEETFEADFVDKFLDEIECRLLRVKLSYIGGFLTVGMLKKLLFRNFKVNSILILSFLRYSENHHEVKDVLEEYISVKGFGECRVALCQRDDKRIEKREGLMELLSLKDSNGKGLLYHALRNERAEIFAYLLKYLRDILGKEQFIKEILKDAKYMQQICDFVENRHINRICGLLKVLHSIFGNEIEYLFDQYSKFLIIDEAVLFDRIDELSNSFEKVISVFTECFGKRELKEFLLSRDSDGDYLTHKLIIKDSNRTFVKNLNLIKEIIDDKDKMKELLKSEGSYFGNIFHLAAWRDRYHNELLQFCVANFEKDEIKDLLLSTDKDGDNEMHFFFYGEASLINNLNHTREIVGDDKWFKHLLKSRGYCIKNILYFSAMRNIYLDDLLQFCDANFEKIEIKEMLLDTERFGRNIVHALFDQNSSETLMKNLKLINEIAVDYNWFNHLLKSKAVYFRNIFHWAATNQNEINISFLSLYLRESEIADLLTGKDKDGKTCLHYAAEYLIQLPVLLHYANKILKFDQSQIKNFILGTDNNGNTFLHFLGLCFWVGNMFDLVDKVFFVLREVLTDELYTLLLRGRNRDSRTFLQNNVKKEIVECCKLILGKDFLEELL